MRARVEQRQWPNRFEFMNDLITRRAMLKGLAGVVATLSPAQRFLSAAPLAGKRLGIGMHSYGIHWNAARQEHPAARFHDALSFLEYGHQLGAGGVQVAVGLQTPEGAARLAARADELGLYLESQALLPRDVPDLKRFEAEVQSARAAGAEIMRTAFLRGRRYETFRSGAAFREFAQLSWESLRLAEPVLRRHRLRLAIENHKDWLIEELLGMVTRISSEWVGVLVDTGNSIALLEDPFEVIRAYAPWAVSTHLKDMAVREYEHGFLLSEVPLGEGFLDLPAIIATLEQANPRIQWNLEMITRDPLQIPCLADSYWETLSGLPGERLARMLRLVRRHTSVNPLPHVSGLSFEERLAAEDRNVRSSLAWAGRNLGR